MTGYFLGRSSRALAESVGGKMRVLMVELHLISVTSLPTGNKTISMNGFRFVLVRCFIFMLFLFFLKVSSGLIFVLAFGSKMLLL